jgi:acetyltransferase-like isoleucine patch superfamily enzyme
MKKYLRIIGLLVTAILPGILKRPVYRICFGYQIGDNVKIGLAFLDCAKLAIADHARISHGVAFLRCGDVEIGKHAIIGLLNLFRGGDRISLGDYSLVIRQNIINAIPDNDCTNNPDPSFYLGYGSVVTAEHRIDFTDRVSIGRCSIFGGRNSTIWTHNRRTGKPVEIGNHCYIGSEIRMAPGAKIPDCCIVGLGSVVTNAHSESYSLFAGVPAKKRRILTSDDYELIFGKTRNDLPDQTYPRPTDVSLPDRLQSDTEA